MDNTDKKPLFMFHKGDRVRISSGIHAGKNGVIKGIIRDPYKDEPTYNVSLSTGQIVPSLHSTDIGFRYKDPSK